MKRLVLALLLLLGGGMSALAQSNTRPVYDNTPQGGTYAQPVDSGSFPLPVQVLGGGSAAAPTSSFNKNIGVTTYTKTTFTLNGSSQILLAASDTRNAVIIYNPSTNGNVWVDLSGGTVASEGGSMIQPASTLSITGAAVPKTAITIIGTNTQSVIVQEGH